MKVFFYRIDLIRKICLVSVIPVALVTLFSKIAFQLIYIFAPLTILLLIGALFLFPFKPKKAETILSEIKDIHNDYLLKIKNSHRDVPEEGLLILEGFSAEKSLISRKIGSQYIAPICRTVVFLKSGESWEMYVKDTSLMRQGGDAHLSEKKYFACKERPIEVELLKYDERTQSVWLSFSQDSDCISLITRGRFNVKSVCDAFGSCFSLSEQVANFVK